MIIRLRSATAKTPVYLALESPAGIDQVAWLSSNRLWGRTGRRAEKERTHGKNHLGITPLLTGLPK